MSHLPYLLNTIDLDNNSMGTQLLLASKSHPGITKRSVSLQSGQRDGNVSVDSGEDSPVIVLLVRVPLAFSAALLALLDSPVLTLGYDGMQATVEMLSADGDYSETETVTYSVVLRFNSLFWRDATPTDSTATAITTTPQPITVMSGLSAPVRDAIIRIKGGITNPRVVDSGGTFIQYTGTVPTTSWLRFELASGRAWITTTDVWTGGTEVAASLVTTGRGPYSMELTPSFTDPLTRAVSLSVVSTARSGSPTVQVRGARAHRI